jgi:hypothetical protein
MVIYLTTHTTTGKKYIGKDISNSPNYFGSGAEIKQIIKTEGKSNLVKTILEHCDYKEDLAKREEFWLQKFDAENNPLFMNRTNKAFGNSGLSDETKLKIKMSSLGKPKSTETRNNMSKGRTGKTRNQTKVRSDKGKPRGISPWISESLKTRNRESTFKPVIQYDLEGNIVREYKSAQEAKDITNLKIQNALLGTTKTSGGYIWKYKE